MQKSINCRINVPIDPADRLTFRLACHRRKRTVKQEIARFVRWYGKKYGA